MERATCKDGRPEGSNRVYHCTHDSPPFDLLALGVNREIIFWTLAIRLLFYRFCLAGHSHLKLFFQLEFDSRSAAWPLFRVVRISDVNTQPFYRQQLADAQGRRRCGPVPAHQNFHHGA
jgi:hypothetical protein